MRVLVTGAQGRKAQIAAVDVEPSPSLDGLVEELRKHEAEPLALYDDMGSADAPGRVVGDAIGRFGGLDGLVSNAGINRPGPLVDYSVEDWDRMFAVNTRATWLLAKAAHPALKTSRGAIVAVGSMSGTNAHANLGPYGPTKAAVIMLARVLAQEFGRDGIRVNTVSPGMVRTGMTARVYADQRASPPSATPSCPSGGSRRRRTSPTSSRSCWVPTRATSTATTSSSTAASAETSSDACRGPHRSRAAERLLTDPRTRS